MKEPTPGRLRCGSATKARRSSAASSRDYSVTDRPLSPTSCASHWRGWPKQPTGSGYEWMYLTSGELEKIGPKGTQR